MKSLLEFLALPLSLPIPPIWDYVFCVIIGEIAYQVAYALAGRYGSSRAERTALHWLIRIPFYFGLWLIVCVAITIVNFIKANWIWVLVVLGIITIAGSTILVVRHFRIRKTEVRINGK